MNSCTGVLASLLQAQGEEVDVLIAQIAEFIEKVHSLRDFKEMVDQIKALFKNKTKPAQAKLVGLRLLNECMLKGNSVFLQYVAKKMLSRLIEFGKYRKEDPNPDRGATMFKSQSQEGMQASSEFLQLLLICIKTWASQFGKLVDGSPSYFLKAYTQLMGEEVQFPKSKPRHISLDKPSPPPSSALSMHRSDTRVPEGRAGQSQERRSQSSFSHDSLLNQICEVCQEKAAAFCCNCKIPPAVLCDGHCFFLHQSKDPSIPHSILPISAAGHDPDEYMLKFHHMKKGIAELRRKVQLMDQFEQEFCAAMNGAIEYLQCYKDSKLQWLRNEKEQLSVAIEKAVTEAQNCMAQGARPASPLAESLWTLSPQKLPLVSYSVNVPDFGELCESWVTYNNAIARMIPSWRELGGEICVICSGKVSLKGKRRLPCGHSCHAACENSSWQRCPQCGKARG